MADSTIPGSTPNITYTSETSQAEYDQYLRTGDCLFTSLTMLYTDSNSGITITNGIIDNIVTIEGSSDAINKGYVISSKKPSGPIDSIQYNDNGTFNGSGALTFSGNFDTGTLVSRDVGISDSVTIIGSKNISNVQNPLYDLQLANKQYIDKYRNLTNVVTIDSTTNVIYNNIANTLILRSNVPSGNDLSDKLPTAVDLIKILASTDISVTVASTGSLTLVGTQTVDGVMLAQNDLILVKDQLNPVENGIYTVKIGSWIRSGLLEPSAFDKRIYVNSGTLNNNLQYTCSDGIYNSFVGTNELMFNTISVVPMMSYYQFNMINKSLDSMIFLSTNTGITFSNSATDVMIPPTYGLSSILYIRDLIPPAITMEILYIGPNVKYLSSNFIENTFQTNLSYKIGSSFMIPGPSTYIEDTSVGHTYTAAEVSKNIIVRNPGSASLDGFDNLLTTSIFTIQNMSANSITVSATNTNGVWVFSPTIITIPTLKTASISLYNTNSINYAKLLGLSSF